MMTRVNRPDRKMPGRLRIVAGKWRSRLLPVIDAPGLRPTAERIRETLFNWLNPITEGARCLDLFAGTGALGIEALSRGASHVVFVEKSAAAADAIKKNLSDLGARNAEVYQRDAFDYLQKTRPQPFDVVFLDPPFDADGLSDLCRLLQQNGWLTPNAIVYLEQSKDRGKPPLPSGWAVSHEKVAGKVSYSLVSTEIET
jgi:16S rRNA (guanine966-N2)-methyltransferase